MCDDVILFCLYRNIGSSRLWKFHFASFKTQATLLLVDIASLLQPMIEFDIAAYIRNPVVYLVLAWVNDRTQQAISLHKGAGCWPAWHTLVVSRALVICLICIPRPLGLSVRIRQILCGHGITIK